MFEAEKSPTFCIYPFVHFNLKTNGRTSLCNRCQPIGHLSEPDLAAFWNSERVKAIRTKMMRGERPQECTACWVLEDSGAVSYRQQASEVGDVHRKWFSNLAYLAEDGSLPLNIKELELRFSNKCNMACKICGPKFSSKWQRLLSSMPEFKAWLDSDKESAAIYQTTNLIFPSDHEQYGARLLNLLDQINPHLEFLMISGGEPLLYDHLHVEVLKRLAPRAANITLEYTSNLSSLNDKGLAITDLWRKFKKSCLKFHWTPIPSSILWYGRGTCCHKSKRTFKRSKTIFRPAS